MTLLPVSEVLRGSVEQEGHCAQNCDQHQFWNRVKRGGSDDCWPWIGSKDKDGYGSFRLNGEKWRAHRFAMVLKHGTSALELHALHTCDNPSCCNPDHLRPATHAENMADRNAKGRQAAGERNGRAKLTEETVRAIREAHVPYKVSIKKLAARFGVNFYIVQDIINRVTWKHVEPRPAPARDGKGVA